MRIIETSALPPANGHYSQAISHNGLLYISGQLPIDPATKQPPKGIKPQTQLVLSKLKTIIEAGGSQLDQVIQVRIYISDIGLWDAVNHIYMEFFGDHKPVRTIVPTRELHFGCLIEVEALAAVGQ